jgi:hypothetical protein
MIEDVLDMQEVESPTESDIVILNGSVRVPVDQRQERKERMKKFRDHSNEQSIGQDFVTVK